MVTRTATAVEGASRVAALLTAWAVVAFVDVFAQVLVFSTGTVTCMTGALVADWFVRASVCTRRYGSSTFVNMTLVFITEVPAVVFPITKQRLINAHTISTFKPPLPAAVILIVFTNFPFIAPIAAIIIAVAFKQIHYALSIIAAELGSNAKRLAGRRFVTLIQTVAVSITIKDGRYTSAIGTLKLIGQTGGRFAALVCVFIGLVLAIGFAITHPGPGNAPARAVAMELP